MTLPYRVALPLLVALVATLFTDPASAQSRRDREAAAGLEQRMQAAEVRYREALVMVGNADPGGQARADSALEDMEDVMAACVAQRDCPVATLLASYKRLLKQEADARDLQDDDLGLAEGPINVVAGGVPEAARAAHLLGEGHDFDRMVEFNPAVQEGIRRWLTDMRPALMTSHENYQYMRHLMWPHYQRAGLPEALLFGIMAKESHGRVHATSRAGAGGPMQFMHATGRRFGLGDDGSGFDTRYDPYSAARASVDYLNERLGQLNRNIELSLAAYNGGEGRALRVFRETGGRSFWDESVYSQFPPETRDYVPMVIAAAWIYLHPEDYGVDFPRVDARPQPLRLSQDASIYQLTVCLGNDGRARDGYMRALRNLNPRYKADDRIPAGTQLKATARMVQLYDRWCTRGERAELARTLVDSDPRAALVRGSAPLPAVPTPAPPPPPAVVREYQVQRGETLGSIARKFGCDAGVLAQANDVRSPRNAVQPGQVLKLQGCKDL
ncbi:transglycosylase SLT domain-containing protein [Lysobacter sp. A3-1-A15]|uniref:transglycosylase SLT domain-containing protein n=1 Tax=Novilysobacter viscosus TaxID=3098602 RepID=UPI002EDB619E